MKDIRIKLSLLKQNQFQVFVHRSDGGWLNSLDTAFMSRVPEKENVKEVFACWAVGATDVTINALESSGYPIDFKDDETEQKYQYIKMTTILTRKIQENYAKYKEDKTVPAHTYTLHPEHPLGPYQQVGLVNSRLSEGFGLFMEQGTGKTPIVIADACNMEKGENPLRVIIIAPKNVRLNWKSEWDKFSTVKHKCTVLRGGQVRRLDQLIYGIRDDGQDISVIIVSYETLSNTWDALSMMEWDLAVLDEGHYFKSPRTKRWEYCKKLRAISVSRRVLTGTPIANSIMDLWTLFEFMGEGYSGFTTFDSFKKFFGVYKKNADTGFEALVACENIPILKDRLTRYTFAISKKEALPNLPDKIYDIEEVEMSEEQTEVYNELAHSLAVEIETDMEDTENPQLIINNVLTKLLKLAQITSGFLKIPAVNNEEGEVVKPEQLIRFAPNSKIEAVLRLLEEKDKNQKTIIWACWVEDIKAIERALQLAGYNPVSYYGGTSDKDRETAEWRFNNDPDCTVLIGNAAAGGTGLNLLGYPPGRPEDSETNCDHVIYFSQDWSSLKRSQSEDRAHRRGTRNPVRITDLCVPETIDEEIRVRVLDKRRAAFEITDVREILKGILK